MLDFYVYSLIFLKKKLYFMAGIIDSVKDKLTKISQLAQIKKILSNPEMSSLINSLSEQQKVLVQKEFGYIAEKVKEDGSFDEQQFSSDAIFASIAKVFTPEQREKLEKIMSGKEMQEMFKNLNK
jgi:DNA-binding TFAR19-related protein (PDSD5 family)